MKVLIAEDDEAMAKIIRLYFEREGYTVATVATGTAALDLLCGERFDLAILDWMMPAPNGPEICREVRKLNISVKTLLLTARSTTDDEVAGLKSGADDYLRKPFEPKVLLLRAKKLLGEQLLHCGKLTLDRAAMKVTLDSIDLMLSKKEYELLEFFMLNRGVVLSRDTLLNRVWGDEYDGDDRTVDTHIRRLRAKIGEQYVTTHRGLGYCMEKV